MKRLALLFALLVPLPLPAADVPEAGKPGGLRAMLGLTLDEGAVRRAWGEATDSPKLPLTRTVRRGGEVTTVLIFQGCAPDAAGRCDLVVEFSMSTPTGQRVPGGTGVLWSAAPLPGRWMLGSASMSVGFQPGDEAGAYQLHAKVLDRIASRTLELSTPLRVE